MSTQSTLIHSEVDLTLEGKHTGHLRLPYSVHRSAYGWLPMPICSIKNGDGPRVLLTSGTHGDEYEGQVCMSRLIRELEPSDVSGQLIILPMTNYPAAKAGLRTSPIDEGNLNREYPGDARGSMTQMIAHYVEEVLMPLCDAMFDLHSGGSSLIYVPSVQVHLEPDGSLNHRVRELAEAFACPVTQVYPCDDAGGMSEAGARRKGLLYFCTELAGAGMVTPEANRIAFDGMRRTLHSLGALHSLPEDLPASAPRTQFVNIDGEALFCYASEDGLFEPLVELGEWVEAGQPAALIHTPESPLREPTLLHFDAAGLVVCKRVPGRTLRGDCLYHIGAPWHG